MMAAIYARKSTDQKGVSEEEKSVTRQVTHARDYAESKGWTVADEHIYVDDGISGAEFAGRPGYMRLLNALHPHAPFDGLVVSELSRLGREQLETGYALKQLSQAGVAVWSYLEDHEVLLDTPTDKFLMSAVSFAAEMERERARQRACDAMQRKARAGHVTGGRTFGYDNVDITDETGRRVRVERRVNETEAAVVRRIFERCARGEGLVTTAKQLNAAGEVAPRAQQGRPCAWAPSSVREMLHRDLYRGELVWNKTRKRDQWGRTRRSARPVEEWIRVPVPELRIVPDALWQAAHARLDAARAAYLRGTGGRLWGRPDQGVESKYLLTGLVRCYVYGGSIYVKSRSHGRRRFFLYGCTSYHLRGRSVCPNGIEVSMEPTNQLVLDAFASDILRPEYVEQAIDRLVAWLQPAASDLKVQRAAFTEELGTVERESDRLTAAITAGGELGALVEALKARDGRRQALQRELARCGAAERIDVRQIRQEARRRLVDWRGLLQAETVKSRQMLKKLLAEPLRARPFEDDAGRGWELTGRASLGGLISGVVGVANTGASPTGIGTEGSLDFRRLFAA